MIGGARSRKNWNQNLLAHSLPSKTKKDAGSFFMRRSSVLSKMNRSTWRSAQLVDYEVTSLMRNAFKRAHNILKKYRRILDSLAARLVENKTIEPEEFDSILSSFGLAQVRGTPAASKAY